MLSLECIGEVPEEDQAKIYNYANFVMIFTDNIGSVIDINGRKYSLVLDKSDKTCYKLKVQRSY